MEQLGREPNPDDMPVSPMEDFDTSAQQAYYLYTVLPDKVDSMGGIWLGKDFAGLQDIMDIKNIHNRSEVFDYLMYMIQITRSSYAKQRELESKMKKK